MNLDCPDQTDASRPGPRFWKRQFARDPSSDQQTFDSIFGLFLPVLCVVMDPCIFTARFE